MNRTRKKGWLPPSLESRIANRLLSKVRFQRLGLSDKTKELYDF